MLLILNKYKEPLQPVNCIIFFSLIIAGLSTSGIEKKVAYDLPGTFQVLQAIAPETIVLTKKTNNPVDTNNFQSSNNKTSLRRENSISKYITETKKISKRETLRFLSTVILLN